jgi:hypothetical protein
MYQAQITHTATGTPVTDLGSAVAVSAWLGGTAAEAVDAELGIWLIDLNGYNADRVERDGYLGVSIKGYTVEIDTP